jgi:hypothetical protein
MQKSFQLPTYMRITLIDLIKVSKGRNMKQTADTLRISITTLQRVLKHFEVGTWPEFTRNYQSDDNAVGPAPGNGAAAVGSAPGNGAAAVGSAPGNGAAAVGSAPGNGAAAVGSAPGNGAAQAIPKLVTQDDSDDECMSSPFPESLKEELSGDEDADDEHMFTEDEESSAEEEHSLAFPQGQVEGIVAHDGGALNDNTTTTDGHKPWPFGHMTMVSPTKPLF